MAFQRISLTPEELLAAFQRAVEPLLYPSETDAPVEVMHLTVQQVGEALSEQDLQRLFYSGENGQPTAQDIRWAEANRLESNGTKAFFGDLADVITTYADNTFTVHHPAHRDLAYSWRQLRDLFFDHLVRQRYFRAQLADPDSARADLYLIGRHLHIEFDPDTNEIQTKELDWFALKTYVIET